MTWNEVTVSGHPCDVYEPSSMNEFGYVLIYLHGVHLNRLVDKDAFTRQFELHGLPVVAPMTGRSWWTDRICEEFDSTISAEAHVRQNIVGYIRDRFGTKERRIGLLGTSMGGQGALRFAYKYPREFPAVAAISPAIDYQLRFEDGDETLPLMYRDPEEVRQDTALLHVHPLNWPHHQFICCDPADERWFESADRLQMKLYSLGIPHEYEFTVTAGGHGFQYYNEMAERAVTFLATALEKERHHVFG